MYKVLGTLNLILLGLVVLPYVLRILNSKIMHIEKPWFNKLLRILHILHKYIAIALLVSIALHGWLAFGAFRLHTGSVAAFSFLITALMGLLFFILKKLKLLKTHRLMALVSVILVAVHLIVPNLI